MKTLPNDLLFAEVTRALAEGRTVRLTLVGNSMQPFLRNGRDTVVLAPFTPEELRPGVIVLFRYRGLYLLHRIVRHHGDRFTICGDANLRPEYATLSDICGIVRSIVRPSGRTVDCRSLSWQLRSRLWMLLRPFRRYLMHFYRRLAQPQ